jgi:hypothetical protein
MRTSTILCFRRCSAENVQTRTVIYLVFGTLSSGTHNLLLSNDCSYLCLWRYEQTRTWSFQVIYTREHSRVTSEDVRLPSLSARGVLSVRRFRNSSNLNMKPSTGSSRHALLSPETLCSNIYSDVIILNPRHYSSRQTRFLSRRHNFRIRRVLNRGAHFIEPLHIDKARFPMVVASDAASIVLD